MEADVNQNDCGQHTEPTFMTNNGPSSCLEANDSCHIVTCQDNHCDSVETRQNPTPSLSMHQADYDAFIVLWLRII